MPDELRMFVPITKIDEEKRQVWGAATVEQPDHAGEILDWQSSRPEFEKWSAAQYERSAGKSLGNLRAQHNPMSAAGRLVSFQPDDAHKTLWVGAEVVDENEWKKVKAGVYTGFSVGGRYAKRWRDQTDPRYMRYTAEPHELSLVDAPCVPGAGFQVIKADGSTEAALFKADGTGAQMLTLSADLEKKYPNVPAELTAKMDSCVEQVMADGKDKESAIAICYTTIMNKAIPAAPLGTDTVIGGEPALQMPTVVQAVAVDPANPPTGAALIAAGQPAQDVSADAARLAQSSTTVARAANKSYPLQSYVRTPGATPVIKKEHKMSTLKVVTPVAPAMLAKRARAMAAGLAKQAQAGEISPALLLDAGPALSKLAAVVLEKMDASNIATAAQDMVSAVQEQAKSGEVDAGLLANIASTLGTLAEMVDNLEPQAEAAMQAGLGEGEAEEVEEGEIEDVEAAKAWDAGDLEKAPKKKGNLRQKNGRMNTKADKERAAMFANMEEADTRTSAKAIGVPAPVATTPPSGASVLTMLQPGAAAERVLPEFIGALGEKNLRKAQKATNDDPQFFDEALALAGHKIMDDIGLSYRNRGNLAMKAMMGTLPSGYDGEQLSKAITAGDMPGINLIPLVQLMLPVYSGLGTRFGLKTPRTGSNQATWRSLIGFASEGASAASAMSVAEGGTGHAMTESFLTYNAPYRDTTVNDKASLKATFAARGFDDPLQVAVMNSLAFLLGVRERNLLYSNVVALGAPTNVAGAAGGTGGSLASTSGSAGYTVSVTALSGRGYTNGDIGGASTSGETDAGAATAIATSGSTSKITVTWTPVKGAVAYNVYISNPNGATQRYVATTGATSYIITAYPGSGAIPPASDTTANSYGYNGLFSWAQLASVYSNASPTPKSYVDALGTNFTAGDGGVTQVNQVLRELWLNWKIAPTLAVMSPRTQQALTSKILSLNSSAMYRIEIGSERSGFTGGAFVSGIVNPFAAEAGGGIKRVLDVMGSPYMPDGTVLILSESAPYGTARNSRIFEAEQLIPFTYFPLAQTDLNYPFAMTMSEVLICYHPSAQAAVVGLDPTA